jgi:hypothetical protein
MHKTVLWALTAGLFALSQIAAAEVQINGFASVVMGIDLDDDGADGPEGKRYNSRTVDNLQQSRVALQWSADLEKGMRFVGQTVARGNASTGFALNYDWAYFDFNVGDAGKLKVGRLRIPFYKYSDYLDVGYAYHWITPPRAMYSLSFSNIDGLGYQQNFENGGLEHSLNVVFGAYQGDLPLGGVDVASSLENFLAINWSATLGNHDFYAAYAQADVYIPSGAAAGLSNFTATPNDVLINGDYGHFFGIGYVGTFGDVGIFSEYSQVGIEDSILTDSSGGYISAAYTMSNYVYHITYEFQENKAKSFSDGNVTAAALGGTTLNSNAKALGGRRNHGTANTITIGGRKDIGISTALKLDLSLYTEDKFQSAAATAESEETATIITFAIETMF